jgi:hypothetical protein
MNCLLSTHDLSRGLKELLALIAVLTAFLSIFKEPNYISQMAVFQ